MNGIEIEVNSHSPILSGVLYEIFSKVPAEVSADRCCYSSDYEVIVDNESKHLPQPAYPKDLAEFLTRKGKVMTCGRFFCYPAGASAVPISTFTEFENSLCETVILVIDVSFIEIYSKNSQYLKDVMDFLQQQNTDIVKAEYVCGETVGRTTLEI